MKKVLLAAAALTSILLSQTSTPNGVTKISSSQTRFQLTTGLTVQETNMQITGPITTGISIALPAGGCKYTQVFLNGLKQTAGTNLDYTLTSTAVTFASTVGSQGDAVSVVCYN